MPNSDEKAAFSDRLNQAIKRSLKRHLNATELSTQFNLRHPNESITAQAAQKWLTGKAKPTTDKISTLAKWLDVPFHWLSYGSPEPFTSKSTAGKRQAKSQEVKTEGLNPDEQKLIGKYRCISPRQQELVYEITEAFALEREIFQPEK